MKIQYRSKELIIFESALFRTTTSLIIGQDYLLLIDPNWLPIELDFIENTVASLNDDLERFLLFTHSDYDHIIGYEKFKHYKTIASQNFVENTDQAAILKQIATFDDANYISRDYKISYPKIDIPISEDNERLLLGEDEYLFYQAKGHNQDGIFVYNKTKQVLISGDYLCSIEFPYIYDSLKEYKQTLSKFDTLFQDYSVKVLVPGHGDHAISLIDMLNRLKDANEYLTELESSIINNVDFDKERLFRQYHFPIIMNQFHQNNVKLVKRELDTK
jgi:glyoxylase-like metal-dependent hydrolase (beta-lactamase superfamily II)